jgi:heme-degrading monooxygenase HmoA
LSTKEFGLAKKKDVTMIAVIFEVWPKTSRRQDYLNIAAELKPLLEKVDGFISIERFESLYEPGKILSLSFFRDEAAVTAWRNTIEHRKAQSKGRHELQTSFEITGWINANRSPETVGRSTKLKTTMFANSQTARIFFFAEVPD